MELPQGEDGGDKQDLWLDLFYSGGASTTGAARLSSGGKLVLGLGLTGLSPITGSVGAEGNGNAAACAISLSCSHQSYLLQFQILPPQLINVLRADISLTSVFCN